MTNILKFSCFIANFNKSNDTFEKLFLSFRALNIGNEGNKIQNVLWFVYNMKLRPYETAILKNKNQKILLLVISLPLGGP